MILTRAIEEPIARATCFVPEDRAGPWPPGIGKGSRQGRIVLACVGASIDGEAIADPHEMGVRSSLGDTPGTLARGSGRAARGER